MLYAKMNQIIDEVKSDVAERDELVECIAIALLSRKNLFILGETGQAKSYAINLFRKRIIGAKQFERLMSKQTDEEQIFGRLDLSSLIPGNMPLDELMKEESYAELYRKLSEQYEIYCTAKSSDALKSAYELSKQTDLLKHIICTLKSGTPKMITEGKIPDSHIVFLDEIFKSGDGILNSLLTALNEKVYTNEGQTVPIPVISFFSASNEIPNFNDSAQAILKPLYDRFELKVLTQYVQEKDNRLKVLSGKQGKSTVGSITTIDLSELETMQKEVEAITVPDSINELMDDVLCELRRCGIHVSDRKYFGFTPIVRAKAYLNGNTEVVPKDLLVLKNYFWNKPEEIATVEKVLTDLCENPIGAEIERILEVASESKSVMDETLSQFETGQVDEREKIKPYVVFQKELFRIYLELTSLRNADLGDSDNAAITDAENELEEMLVKAAKAVNATSIPLHEQKRLNV